MTQFRFSIALTLALGVAATANAQTSSYPWRARGPIIQRQVDRPAIIQRRANPVLVSFGSQDQDPALQDAQPSASDVQQVPQPQAVTPQPPGVTDVQSAEPSLMTQSNAAQDSYFTDSCQSCSGLGPQRHLFGSTAGGTQVGGWMNYGYHNRDTPLINNRSGEGNLHQAWFYVDRAANADSCNWSLGYRVDLLYGIDGQDLQAFGNSPTGAPSGWDNSWDYGSYGWAMPQAYVQVANSDWDVRLGKFFAPFGYESIGARDNFFYSHTYTDIWTQPQTFSGIIGERYTGANSSVIVGATAGWDTGFDNNTGGALIFGTRYALNEYVNVRSMVSAGDTGIRDTGWVTSTVVETQLTNCVRHVIEVDTLNLNVNQEFGVVNYLIRDVNERLALGARLEWWRSDRFNRGNTSSTNSFTMGANYWLNANFRIRPELRFDWGALAVDNGQPIVGIDAVLTF